MEQQNQENQENQEPAQAESPEIVQPETPPPAPVPSPPNGQPPPPDAPPAPQPDPPPVFAENRVDFRSLTREARTRKHEARLEKLLAFARERRRVNNNDIQKLLRVSDATATRYAKILITRGFVKKSGKTRGTAYESAS